MYRILYRSNIRHIGYCCDDVELRAAPAPLQLRNIATVRLAFNDTLFVCNIIMGILRRFQFI